MRPESYPASAHDSPDLKRPSDPAVSGVPATGQKPGARYAGPTGLRATATALAAAAVLLAGGSAHAIGDAAPIDLNKFHPAPGNSKILTVDLAEVGPHLQLVPQLFLHYARRPLVYTVGGIPKADLVQNRLTADLSISLALWRHLQIAIALPVTLYQNGTLPQDPFLPDANGATPAPNLAAIGQEDLRVLFKGSFYNSKPATAESPTFGVGAIGDLSLPTGNADSYLGSRLPSFQLRLAAHIKWRHLTAALNFGGTFGTTESLYDVHTGSGLVFGVGAQVELFHVRTMPFYLLTEVFGTAHYPFDSFKSAPAELTAAVKTTYRNWTFFLGGGPGLNPGYGVPDGRAYFGLTYAWQRIPQAPPPAPPPPPPPPLPPPPQPPPPPPLPPPSCEGEDCPDNPKRPAHVEIKGQKLNLSERIFFDFDRDTIKPISFPVLDEVVSVLKARPDIKRIRIEGHTDNKGSDMYNLDLSHRRAQSVMVYLVEKGIETWRLTSAGFGFRCPLVPNDTPDNRAQNRRVDFIIIEQEGVKLDPPKCQISLLPNR